MKIFIIKQALPVNSPAEPVFQHSSIIIIVNYCHCLSFFSSDGCSSFSAFRL